MATFLFKIRRLHMELNWLRLPYFHEDRLYSRLIKVLVAHYGIVKDPCFGARIWSKTI